MSMCVAVPKDSHRSMSTAEHVAVGKLRIRKDQYQQMEDSSAYFREKDWTALRIALKAKGYILLRGVVDVDKVAKARSVVTSALHTEWKCIDCSDDKSPLDAYCAENASTVLLTGYRPVTHHKDTLEVLEGCELCDVFTNLFQEKPSTFNTKWVRVHCQGSFTDEHTDYYRFSGNAFNMCTCWVPLGSYRPEEGTLIVCEGSHNLEGYDPKHYSMETKLELPPTFDEYLRKDEAVWRTTSFEPGDIVIFDIRLIHASTVNTANRYRISMDTRWQPSSFVSKDSLSSFTSL